ncbi:CUB domain protein [Cooperia oncophora]
MDRMRERKGLSELVSNRQQYSIVSRNDCHDIVLTLPEGTIASPNYPQNYTERTFCQWHIRAKPGQIIIINVEDIAVTHGDTLLLEGNQGGDNLSLKSGSYPSSYISKSSEIHVKFVSGSDSSARGFLLHYRSRDSKDVCHVAANTITYESWRENYDCVYSLASPGPAFSIVLEIYPTSIGERTTINILFENTAYSIEDARTTQILVIPSSDVRVEVRNAWLSEQPLELPLNLNAFTFNWFPSNNPCCSFHALRLDIQSATRFLPHTLVLDGHLSTNDAITVVKDGSVTHLSSPTTFRVQDLHEHLHLLITKRSASFRVALTFSRDCSAPPESPHVQVLSPSGRQLGSVIQFSCANSNAEPHEPEVVFCPLPVIPNGYVFDVMPMCAEGSYCNGTILFYQCDFGRLPGKISTTSCKDGKWDPSPICHDTTCPSPEAKYLNATLSENPPLGLLSHAVYTAPDWSLEKQPFRVCAMNESGTSFRWLDYNFAFEAPICRSYPVKYGHFVKEFYQDGETAKVVCLDGFFVDTLPKCAGGNWTSYNVTCIGEYCLR